MTAHILIVEDDDEFADTLDAMIAGMPGRAQVTFVRSREAACEALNRQLFDFAVLDLKIPTEEGRHDANPEHGKYVFHYARSAAPGTKLLVLTGSPSEDFTADMLAQNHQADIWAQGRLVNTVEFLRKIDIDKAPELIANVKAAIVALDEIEVVLHQINLETAEDRLLRIFAKRFEARRCVVTPIKEGKSGAKPLRIQLFDRNGSLILQSFAKLGPLHKIRDESGRHDRHIVLLRGAATPRKLSMLEFGAWKSAGIFYQLADGFSESIFDLIGKDVVQATTVLESVSRCVEQWTHAAAERSFTVADIRRSWVDDDKAAELQELYELEWARDFEVRQVQVRWCCVHGDLHGANILVSSNGDSILIDYGDVQHSAVSYDPISLELSLVLQDNPSLSKEWPDHTACRNWNDIDSYVTGSPIEPFIRNCRQWAEGAAAGKREVAAAAYTYLLRQLKYDDTDKSRILALMEGVQAYMHAT